MTPKPMPRKPSEKREWHLVCITRKGKVSMLDNLTLTMARETYKKLLPGTYPVNYYHPKCRGGKLAVDRHTMECKALEDHYSGGWVSCGDGKDREPDRLEKVEALGPKGKELNPWAGCKPREVRMHCHCKEKQTPAAVMKQAEMQIALTGAMVVKDTVPRPKRRATIWLRHRTDFWNHPRLWDRVKDPHRQLCWEMVR